MLPERHPAEGPYPAFPPAYERSAWLDVHNKAIQVEGDPETEEEFAAAYDFLHVMTVFYKTGPNFLPTPMNGRWWLVTADDITAELDLRNAAAVEDAQRQQQTDETATATEVQLAQVLALSYRRLQALEESGGPEQPEYALFLHLHEQIRQARLAEAELDQVLPQSQEPASPVSEFLRTPVWKQLYETYRFTNPAAQTQVVLYSRLKAARFAFVTTDLSHPHRPETAYEQELHFFPIQEQAVAVQYEYGHMGYMVGDVVDYQENVTIAEPWEPRP